MTTAFPGSDTNALALFLPNDRPSPDTLNHLLSLPPLVQPLSPPLAALHLARIRLLLSIPSSSLDGTGWCRTCGKLREGGRGKGKNKAKKAGVTSTVSHENDDCESPRERRTTCEQCGASFKPKPDPATRYFPPARAVRVARARGKTVPTNEVAKDSRCLVPLPPESAPDPSSDLMDVDDSPSANELERNDLDMDDTSGTIVIPAPPRYVTTPSLSYVRTSSPNPPTYPPPPPRPGSPTSAGGKDGKAKKRKRSGLARLLAENRERELGSTAGSGSWGLG